LVERSEARNKVENKNALAVPVTPPEQRQLNESGKTVAQNRQRDNPKLIPMAVIQAAGSC
jgi:hypothetical protein